MGTFEPYISHFEFAPTLKSIISCKPGALAEIVLHKYCIEPLLQPSAKGSDRDRCLPPISTLVQLTTQFQTTSTKLNLMGWPVVEDCRGFKIKRKPANGDTPDLYFAEMKNNRVNK